MQDVSHLVRNLFLIGIVSLGAPVAGCTVVDEEEPDAQIHTDAGDDDDDLDADDGVDVEVDD